MALFLWSVMET